MADTETTINTVLTANAAVKRRVNARIYPIVMPQNPVLPAITYQRISAAPVNHLGGYSGLLNAHVVINSWATEYGEAKALAKDVRTAMNTAAMKNVLTNDLDGYDPDINLFVVSQDYSCWNAEV